MEATETASAASAAEVKAAMDSFMSDLRTFRSDVQTRIKQQEERVTMLDRKTALIGARPALATEATVEAPHQKAFDAYLRTGSEDGLRGLEIEAKGLSSVIAGDGGYLVDPATARNVQAVLQATASLRAVASVVTVEAASYDVLVDKGELGAEWAGEIAARGETASPQIERVTIPLHELSALPKASQRLLDDAAFDVDGWLAERIADKFARAEASAFVAGDGADKPRGFLDHGSVANFNWVWGKLGHVITGVDGALNGPDTLIDLIYSLEAPYRANATFVLNSKTAGVLRKLKDSESRFLWSDGLAAGEPARLMGYPVLICEDMPDIDRNATPIAFGDFRKGYTIAERRDLRLLRDPFSAKPHVLFYATKRIGGDVTDFAAIKLLKFSD